MKAEQELNKKLALVTDCHLNAVTSMLANAEEMLEQSYHRPDIDQNRWVNQAAAFKQVVRYLENHARQERAKS